MRNVNPKYGSEHGVQFVTHISDLYAPFRTMVDLERAVQALTDGGKTIDETLLHQLSRRWDGSTSN